MEGTILALDNGWHTGWAFGEPGQRPRSGSEDVTVPDFLDWLNTALRRDRPRLVVVEDVLPLAAYRRVGTSEATVYDALKRRGVVEACCGLWSIELRAVDVLDVRKHFTGKRSHGGREAGKLATISRCRQLRYVGPEERNEDRCDALAIWDWACATIARVAPKELHMFGGG